MFAVMKKMKKRARKPGYELSPDDVDKLKPMTFVIIYSLAAVLVAVPGVVVTDVLGSMLALPFISSWLVQMLSQGTKRAGTGECP